MTHAATPFPSSASGPAPEKTFRTFTASQSATYADVRFKYHPKLYSRLLSHHLSTGGSLSTILDVGCGPGTAISSLHGHFEKAIGVDPSPSMIETARSLYGDSHPDTEKKGIEFILSTAEALEGIESQSVDLIIAANAAHWFDMAGFWRRAAEVLKPGGTVAVWGGGPVTVGAAVPGREAVQAAIERLEERISGFYEPGNHIVRGLYRDLVMPWDAEEGDPVRDMFVGREGLIRWEWGTDTEGSFPSEELYVTHLQVDMNTLGRMMETSSPVIRWREAHPAKVGTEEDVVSLLRKEIQEAMWAAGVKKGEELKLEGGVSGCMLVVKRTDK